MFNHQSFDQRMGSRSVRRVPRPVSRPNLEIRNVFAFLVLGLLLLSGAAQAGPGVSEDPGGPLDLNRATMDQLESLPGIGAVKAAAILAVRDARGGFRSMEELETVRGIGPALVARIRPLVVLGSTDKSKRAKKPRK